ncbi:MAG TPA: hypothetical protein VMG99_00645 [Thermoplasmata archaeon]|jgi:hypothetical protein|nr:hypothetical protein [Thermoplasmata archaeon]
MDGRLVTVLLTFLLPAVLIGVTVVWFASNPVSIFVLFSVMVGGGLYLLSYTESFA